VWTEEDDEEIEYGKWHFYDGQSCLAEEQKIHPPKTIDDIWPHWGEGVPTKLRRTFYTSSFSKNGVYHRARRCYASLELKWHSPRSVSSLRKDTRLLPSSHQSEWSGVYRIFSPDTTIDRFCGNDPTGTLYLGLAGTGEGNWSILRNRIQAIARRDHHATQSWSFSDLVRQKYPWESLAIEWACTGDRQSYKGEMHPVALMAESWLLHCYNDAYGEFPPLNQKG
jgi:hypothetical protein